MKSFVAVMALVAGAANAATDTASVSPGIAFLNAAGTPNDEYVDTFVSFDSDGLRAIGSGSLANGDSVASGSLDARFGNAVLSANAVAAVQPPETAAGDLRDPAQPGSVYSSPLALVRSFTYDFIAVDTAATGPLYATFSVDLTGDVAAAGSAGTARAFGSFNVYSLFASGNVFAQFSRSTTVIAEGGTTTTETRDSDGVFSGDAFAGTLTGTIMFTGADAYNPFMFDLLCQTILTGIGPADSGAAGCNGLGYRWGGISAVRDDVGNLVADWSVLSSSGFDYAQADPGPQALTPREVVVTLFPGATMVPEPATWALLLTGFGATGLAVRRRRALA